MSVLLLNEHPAVYTGNFNSRSIEWGHEEVDKNGDIIKNWLHLK